jgi:hypothetical protein
MRENKIGNFKTRLTMVSNKEHPNYDDILKIEEEYEKNGPNPSAEFINAFTEKYQMTIMDGVY